MCIGGEGNTVEIWYKRARMEKEFSIKAWNKVGLGKKKKWVGQIQEIPE